MRSWIVFFLRAELEKSSASNRLETDLGLNSKARAYSLAHGAILIQTIQSLPAIWLGEVGPFLQVQYQRAQLDKRLK